MEVKRDCDTFSEGVCSRVKDTAPESIRGVQVAVKHKAVEAPKAFMLGLT